MSRLEFEIKLEKVEGIQSAFIIVPFDVLEVFGTRAQVKVKGTVDGSPFRSSVAPMGDGKHYMVINKDIRSAIGKEAGDHVRIVMERDTDPRRVEIPDDLQVLLEENPSAQEFFERLAYTHQKEYVNWIIEAKRAETRAKRLQETLERLLAGEKPK